MLEFCMPKAPLFVVIALLSVATSPLALENQTSPGFETVKFNVFPEIGHDFRTASSYKPEPDSRMLSQHLDEDSPN